MKQFKNRLRFLRRRTLADQFLFVSLIILLGGMLLIGWWVSSRIQDAVINQTASVTALYIKSFIAPLLQPLITHDTLDSAEHRQLQNLVANTPFGDEIVSVKVWSPSSTILFSLDASLIGQQFTGDDDLKAALGGQTVSHLSDLDKAENASERKTYATLIETYVPIYVTSSNQIIAVVEFYQFSAPLLQQISTAQQQSWLVVGVATMIMYVLLSGMVSQGSRTIEQQREQLQQSVHDLAALLEENRELHHRLQAAAARDAELNEQFLHRIGRDLHDGPAQDLALALLRLDEVFGTNPTHLETIRHALQSSLHEIRTLAAGLQLPELQSLETADVARRALREFQRKTGRTVEFEIAGSLPSLSLSKKIAIYRVIAESLHNSYRHAGAKDVKVKMGATAKTISVEISDSGPGFDPAALKSSTDHLGIAGLQQRIALLTGTFELQSSVETGTRVCVTLPLKEG